MTRLLRALLVVILGWIGFSSTAEAEIAEPVPSIVHAYDYDGMTLPSPEPNLSLSERGPPSRGSGWGQGLVSEHRHGQGRAATRR